MENTKSLFQSKTFWLALCQFLAAMFGDLGVQIIGVDFNQSSIMIGFAITIIIVRYFTEKPIKSFFPKEETP